MELRKYRPSDCAALAALFCDTVRRVNARDYTQTQIDAWLGAGVDLEAWDRSLRAHYCLVAVEGETILGFGDIDASGYLDRLYVRADHQGRGVASAICDQLEPAASGRIVTHASITARPFFEGRGYRVVRAQRVERCGVTLSNFVMEKEAGAGPK